MGIMYWKKSAIISWQKKKIESMCFVLYINIDTYCPLLLHVYLIFYLCSNKEMDMLDSF